MYQFAQADALRLPLADQSVNLVMGSPPYMIARTYGIGAQRECTEWVRWMADVTVEALRVTQGAVLWVCDGIVRKRAYWPGCEGLVWEMYQRGYTCERPLIWKSNKAPTRHGEWWTHCWEYVLAFKRPGALPYFDWQATATKTKYATAGAFRQRRAGGDRPARLRPYVAPKMAHPRDIIAASVGGGHLGHPLAHENEAPYPERLVEQIVPVLVPPGGIVCDPFSGSGTTVSVAVKLGRRGIGFDLRASQCELAYRRMADAQLTLVGGVA